MVIQTKSSLHVGSDNGNNGESNISENSANMKTKSESASNVLNSLKKRKITSQSNGADSLDILKDNLQYFFNEKINGIMKEFIQTFLDPAIKNIRENNGENVTDQQIKKICRNLLEGCVKSHYSSSNDSIASPSSSSLSSHTPDMSTSDSDTSENGGTSLLHQALKRKRTDSETEQLFKRQFFLTTAPPNHYFNTTVTNTTQISGKTLFRPTTSVLSSPRFITRPLQPGMFNQTGTSTRPIFHIIQAPNRNLKLSATHVELCQLLKQNNSTINPQPTALVTASENDNIKLEMSSPKSSLRETDTKN